MQKQYYGIKYPFTCESDDGTFIDLNKTPLDKVRSELYHVIFTPKGQRLRMPEFGTNLMQYIFNPNDDLVWGNVRDEISSSVGKFIKNIKLYDIEILRDENNDNSIYVQIEYGSEDNNIVKITKDIVKI